MPRGIPRVRRTVRPIGQGTALGAAVILLVSGCGGAEAVDRPADAISSATTATADGETAAAPRAIERSIRVVATYPHDTVLYTQGLEFVDDLLVESGGQTGESRLRVYDPESGEVLVDRPMSEDLFAEGSTVVGDRVWQLTYQTERGFVYDLDDLEPVSEFDYEGEGWGLCSFANRFVMSNGTDVLTFRSLDDFSVEGSVPVRLDGAPVENLNELECIESGSGSEPGERVWANVYRSNVIYGIDPATGSVTDSVDLSELVPPGFEDDLDQVLNGIAHHRSTGRFWVTGKRWPVLYEIELIDDSDP